MSPLRPLSVFRTGASLAAAAGFLIAVSPSAAAQSGSESTLSTASNALSGGGTASSASYVADVGLAHVTAGPTNASTNYLFSGGAVWTTAELGTAAPVVFGVSDPAGSKDGGDARTLFGANLLEPGAGVTTVSIGGAAASAVIVQTDTTLTLTTPAGVNVHGNPLGLSDVLLANSLGASQADDAYRFDPSLTLATPAQLGTPTYGIRLQAQPGSFSILALGLEIPGLTIPFAGLDGALELPLILLDFPLAVVPTGTHTYSFPLPNDPALSGAVFPFQAASIESIAPFAGSFTNILHVAIQD